MGLWLYMIITQVCVVVEGRYLVEVRLNGYSNPTGKCGHVKHRCQTNTPGEFYCCDSYDTTCSGNERCDSFFFYCLRPLGEDRLGCLDNETRAESSSNENDRPINFSRSRVLGLDNPQKFSGLRNAYKVRQVSSICQKFTCRD